MSWLEGVLIACEGNIRANIGQWKTWDGATGRLLFDEIEHVHGKLWTAFTSRNNLEDARQLSIEQPRAQLWNSVFIRELVLSAMDKD